MIAYADTSFLASLYGADVNTERAAAILRRSRAILAATVFNEFELTNAFEQRVFRKEWKPARAAWSRGTFRADVAGQILLLKPLPAAVFERASRLARRHTSRVGCRALDVLHVASALELNAGAFFTFDKRQRKLARAAGLRVRPAR